MPLEEADFTRIQEAVKNTVQTMIGEMQTAQLAEMNKAVGGMGKRLKGEITNELSGQLQAANDATQAVQEILSIVNEEPEESSTENGSTNVAAAGSAPETSAIDQNTLLEQMRNQLKAEFDAQMEQFKQASQEEVGALQKQIDDRDRAAAQAKMEQAFLTSDVAKQVNNPQQFLNVLKMDGRVKEQNGVYGVEDSDRWGNPIFTPLDGADVVENFLKSSEYGHFAAPRAGTGTGSSTAGGLGTPPQQNVSLDATFTNNGLTEQAQETLRTQGIDGLASQIQELENQFRGGAVA